MTESYDLVVVGAGPGGYVAAIRGAQLGLKTACIEKRSTLGGTCLNVGCIPSKALLQSSEHYAFLGHEANEHGIDIKGASPNLKQMMERKAGVVKGLTDGIAGLLKKNRVTRIQGMGRLLSPNEIEVDDGGKKSTLRASHILLATGSEPIELPFMKFDEKQIISSTGALSLKKVPKKMLVIGGGVIGVELASVYRRLGSEVIVIEMLDQICAGMDHTLTKVLLQTLKKQGIQFHLKSKVLSCKQTKSKVSLEVEVGGSTQTLDGDVALVAIGRKPYTEGLGLEAAGVQMTERGRVLVNGNFQTTSAPIYAIGDVVDGPMLAHKASEEGVAAVECIANQKGHVNYMAIPNVVYTSPEVASVGLTEKEAKAAGVKVKLGQSFFKGNARARCAGEDDGLVKIVGCKNSDRVVGVHIIGPHASELIGEGMLAIQNEALVEDLASSPAAHPTLSEAIKEAALQCQGKAIHM